MRPPTSNLDPRGYLRPLVSAVETEVHRSGPDDPLRLAWTALVDALALGPVPAVRTCPACGAMCMRQATRCGHCWIVLVPPPADRALPAACQP
jgi:hypothetical protein